jgi:hypothetical protein
VAAKKPETPASLKKSAANKLTKIGRTNTPSDISFALRHGKITAKEAAALDPKNFNILTEKPKVTSSVTIDLKTGKRSGIKGSSGNLGGGGGLRGNVTK